MINEMSVTEMQNAAALAAETITQDKAQTYELIGMLKMSAFTKKLVTVTEIKLLSEIKESKQYKGLTLYHSSGDTKKSVTVTTFIEFCEALGMSYEKVNLDIQNLNAFGEDFLETSQRIGLGYRDLRKLRKLPENERDLIINGEAIKVKDKDELVELIEEKSIAYAKEKETLEKQIDELKGNAAAQKAILERKEKKLNELEVKLKRKEIELDDDTERREKLEAFNQKWGEVSKVLFAKVEEARQLTEKAIIPDENLPHTTLQKMALDIGEYRDKLTDILSLLPSDTSPVDTAWLTEDDKEGE